MARGHTLLEIVLVLAVLGVLAVAAIESSPSPTSANVMAAARQIQSDIEYAKQNAMMTGTTSGVYFKKNQDYIVYQGTTSTPLTSPLTHGNMDYTLSTNFKNVNISNTYTVEFDSFGAPTTGGAGSVVITDGTNTKTISVTNNTGMVSIQ
jgi:prepilin-type N-terminal cleavage/methylation domain-containing protein